jgi:dGTPase
MDNIRTINENNEKLFLSPFATLSKESKGREVYEPECELRTAFQRDRDRIIHSKAFRRLKHKTQVFLSPESDHYRTRLTHTLEVSQIARTISSALQLNGDLTEAIALGHDLGHTPFGHAGERSLDKLSTFGFTHFEQSIRVCKFLEKNGVGLNLTWEVLDGILHHTRGDWASTPEGKIVRLSDRIAYINHDIDDAVRAGIIKESDLPASSIKVLGDTKSKRINTLVTALVRSGAENLELKGEINEEFIRLYDFLFESVYRNPKAKSEESKVDGIIEGLFEHYLNNPKEILNNEYKVVAQREGIERAVVDYIAGMTDDFAIMAYSNIYIPKSWNY